MPIINSSVKRSADSTGDNIKTFTDTDGKHIQAGVIVDDSGNQAGITGNPLQVDGSAATQPISVASLPLPSGAATQATLASLLTQAQAMNSMCPAVYDYVALTYTGSNLTGVVFKTGGAGGTTVSTLTLAYSGSQLVSVTKI